MTTRASFYSCKIHDSEGSGIVFYDDATGFLDKSSVCNNKLVGIKILRKEYQQKLLKMQHRTSFKNLIDKSKKLQMEENEAMDAKYHAFAINQRKHTINIDNCKIQNNGGAGIILRDNGLASIISSIFNNNMGPGALTQENSTLIAKSCFFNDGKDFSLAFTSGSTGMLTDCQIYDNTKTDIEANSTQIELEKYFSQRGKTSGINALSGSKVTLNNCTFFNHDKKQFLECDEVLLP